MQIQFARDNQETHSEEPRALRLEVLAGFSGFPSAIPSVLQLSLGSAANATRLKIADR